MGKMRATDTEKRHNILRKRPNLLAVYKLKYAEFCLGEYYEIKDKQKADFYWPITVKLVSNRGLKGRILTNYEYYRKWPNIAEICKGRMRYKYHKF